MFSQWLNTGIRAAEIAIADGRLDDAFARLTTPSARGHKSVERLLDELAKPLMARARLAAQAGRYADAILDLDRLAAVKREDADAAALRQRVSQEMQARVQRHADRGDAFQRAAADIRAGRLESGRLAVERMEDAATREKLREELDVRVQRSGQLVAQASEAARRGDLATACRFWAEAVQRHGRTYQTDALAVELAGKLAAALDPLLAEGRLEHTGALLASCETLVQIAPTLVAYQRIGNLIDEAARRLAAAEFAALRAALLRLKGSLGAAAWIDRSLTALDKLLDAQADLLASPLGGLATPAARGFSIVESEAAMRRAIR
jgi:hypothetical protein